MRKLSWLGIVVLLSACTIKAPDLLPKEMGEENRHFAHFEKVRIEGPFDVDLHTGYRERGIVLKGQLEALPYIETEVKSNTLIVRCPQKCAQHGQLFLRINAGRLRDFNYRGRGKINGLALHSPILNLKIKNAGVTCLGGYLGLRRAILSGGGFTSLTGVKSPALWLVIKGGSRVKIRGEVQLAGLKLEDGAWLSMYWLKGHRLQLRGHGKTVFQFAGMVDVLDVELWGNARFMGRYMRARETFVKTHDHSLAEISTWQHQHTLATDASDIYYYQQPRAKADFMAVKGAVLDLEEWVPATTDNLFTTVNN
jgi:hypothetical protein